VFGLSGEKLLILGAIAFFVLGPERLPKYAKMLANLVKGARRMAEGAKTQLKEELGDEYQEVDWRKLDPRQYDPRRIIREALVDDLSADTDFSKLAAPVMAPVAIKLAPGEAAPFDPEAT
jgi:sec-independent protein translocase protein TatB